MTERPCEREPPHPSPPTPATAPPATIPSHNPDPLSPPASPPAVALLGTGLPGLGGLELAGSGQSAASEGKLGGDEAAPEQLDWGSIDDEDGAFALWADRGRCCYN
jgi:hypothetical protein